MRRVLGRAGGGEQPQAVLSNGTKRPSSYSRLGRMRDTGWAISLKHRVHLCIAARPAMVLAGFVATIGIAPGLDLALFAGRSAVGVGADQVLHARAVIPTGLQA